MQIFLSEQKAKEPDGGEASKLRCGGYNLKRDTLQEATRPSLIFTNIIQATLQPGIWPSLILAKVMT